ncbi:alpha-mannosidase [Paenibacillus gansuensis]|uniref:Alpha-mannosidase n=1 Tax=Paenibacillus gansuensis TaxID=306542 RepID=A0ABW5PM88_9BACL
MKAKRTAHLVSHTHWDREWYLPYEKHHVRLVKLMDTLLDTLESKPEYKSFFLDGQTIIIEDYLQVYPDQKDRLERMIREGRILIGPWYILQDAFLTSSEANVRNLQIGHQDAARYGTVSKIGYFPDTFGIMAQAPQMMKQAGIDNAFFGRGVKPTGFNNEVFEGDYESSFSELIWEGPDGSRVLGILFANWYSNGNEVPADEDKAREYWDRKLADAEKYASTGELLFMNGCDHQPIQTDLPEALRKARELYPDTDFIHSNFPDYLKALSESLRDDLSVVKGELRSQRTDGWSTLVNTASSRVYLKQLNQKGQAMLEKVAEPLATLAHMAVPGAGAKYPHALFTYAWKTLMQNHPHDSICGCSVDEVHSEMVTRFHKSRHVAETIIDDSKQALADAVDTAFFARYGTNAAPFVVFNTSGWSRTGVVDVEVDVFRIYFRDGLPLEEINRRVKAYALDGGALLDSGGRSLKFTMQDLGLQFGYDLPDDKFRQPYMSRRVKLTFEASQVPALGWKTYAWVPSAEPKSETQPSSEESVLLVGERSMENSRIRVIIADDGSLWLTDKVNGRTYKDLCVYENTGDIGNEYMYKQAAGTEPLTTKGLPAAIRIIEQTAYRASFEIVHNWEIPASAAVSLEEEQKECVYFPYRKSGRSERMVPLTIRTTVSLERSGKGIRIITEFDNQALDHRLRVLFPTDLATSVHRADSIFEVAVRDNEPASEWENPSNCLHQQAFVQVHDGRNGLTAANLGLNEYEVLRDGRNTMAVTLLRSVGELGDWGYFPTPEAQCLGHHRTELELIPAGPQEDHNQEAYAEAQQFQIPWVTVQTGVHPGPLKAEDAPLAWEGQGVAFSSMKIGEPTGDVMLRWFNLGREETELSVRSELGTAGAYKSNLLEERISQAEASAASFEMKLGKAEILTIGIPLKS